MHCNDPGSWRRAFLWLMVASLALQSGCVTTAPRPPSREVRESVSVVAIVPAQYIPDSNFNTFAKSVGAGAAKGAAIEGIPIAVVFAAATAAMPFVAPFVVAAGALTTTVATTEGAVEGAQAAVPAGASKEIESVIGRAAAGLDAQDALAGRLATIVKTEPWMQLVSVSAAGPDSAAARPDYARLRTFGIDTVIEVAITEIGFESCGPGAPRRMSASCPENSDNKLIDLFMFAQARIVRASDGAELFVRRFRYKSPRREIQRRVTNDGELLAEEFGQAYRELAERVNDELLLLTPIELPAPSSTWEFPGPKNPRFGICWLEPVYPRTQTVGLSKVVASMFSKPADRCPESVVRFTVIDSLGPTLRWRAFPRDLDRQRLDPAVMKTIRDVTYDLKIWEVEDCERGRLVYERTGLPAPEHSMEASLAPASRYFWSVRARFAVDDRPTATRWSHFDNTNCFPNDIADSQYHRFVTPP